MVTLTLLRQGHDLADPAKQIEFLEQNSPVPAFQATLESHGLPVLQAEAIDILQINLGKLCNQTCSHCHVDAGPERREIMSRKTLEHCLRVVRENRIPIVDVTGGAPEMNPEFRWLIGELRQLGTHVIDRCNLTILLAPGYEDLPGFLAEHQVEIVASLPCYLEENTDRQRGSGVYEKSIAALQQLNELGYGQPRSGLDLSLVYNPGGPALPPDQQQLEDAYRKELRAQHGIEFTRLYTITNMPISRFLDDLIHQGRFEEYMQKLLAAFNPAAVSNVMCRRTLSVDWEGGLHDCDFNQMLDLHLGKGLPRSISEFDASTLARRQILTGRHCYGCTSGAGSSCQGVIT